MAFVELAWDTFYMPMDFVGMVQWKDIVKEIFPMACGDPLNISKKRFFSGRTEPASGRIASALCVLSSWISRAFFAFHLSRLVHADAALSLTVSDALVAAPPPPSASPLYPPP